MARSVGGAKSPFLLPRDPRDKGQDTPTALDRRWPQLVGGALSCPLLGGKWLLSALPACLPGAVSCLELHAAGQLHGAGWASTSSQEGAGPWENLPAPVKGTDGRCHGLASLPLPPILTFQATWPN